MSTVEIARVRAVDDEVLEAFRRLLPQLSSSAAPLTADDLAAILASPGTAAFIARERSGTRRIVGTLTLVTFRIPTGVRAWIERRYP